MKTNRREFITGAAAVTAEAVRAAHRGEARAASGSRIRVDAARKTGEWKHNWAMFGYDEPNYTYTKRGTELLDKLAALSPSPVFLRTHHLLTTGDGAPSLKWGSTNAYTEDERGLPVYDWKILDRIFDSYVERGLKPLVEIGFMPEALSVNPKPYRHSWPEGKFETGWAYPPKDYAKWGELVYQWVRHSIQRYGRQEAASWYWECWNEPDIGFWQGTFEEYFRLYDHTAEAVKRALPEARMGGAHSTGPQNEKGARFLRQFLEHVAAGKNAVTGRRGAPLDYIGFHTKGRPGIVDGHIRMNMQRQFVRVQRAMTIIRDFPELRKLPIIIGECDPDGTAARSALVEPANAYRNGPQYAAYNASIYSKLNALAGRNELRLDGILAWAFQFEDQPLFAGFRTLSTNGIDKPILNFYRMLGLMRGHRVDAWSTSSVALDEVLRTGVRGQPDIDAVAVAADRQLTALVWHYHDDDLPAAAAPVDLSVEGLTADRVNVEHFHIGDSHSNAFSKLSGMGSPSDPSEAQWAQLRAAGQLKLLRSPEWRNTKDGRLAYRFVLPRNEVSLFRLTW